ncbi:MAG TPA: tetratricopeptide repeat protein [Gemmataceae bacterium]|nr:tetratricopeptide repeat protein [Gemmataceae bacterium]
MNSAVNPKATPEFKDRFQEAVELKNQGRLQEAEQKFKDLLAMNPASASVHAFLADTLWDQGQLTQAIASFRKAVELAPKSEMASLGFFHTLLESGDREGAIAEMKRFLSLSDSEEYQTHAQQFECDSKEDDAMDDVPCRLYLITLVEHGVGGPIVPRRIPIGDVHANMNAAWQALQDYYVIHGGANAVIGSIMKIELELVK